jgi:hypothetical protein
VGLVLLAAAGLKLAGQAVSPFAQQGILTAPHLQALAVVWEILLGVWLMSGVYRPAAWLAAVGTFSLFALISGYLGWMGQANCGCFGVIRASPWAAFTIDVIALTLLLLARVNRSTVSPAPQEARGVGFAGLLVGAVLILTLLAVGAWLRYGSLEAALARLHGQSLYAPTYVDFGSASAGQELVQDIILTNWTDAPIRVIGGTSDCSCVTTSSLPLTIPPGERRAVRVVLRPPGAVRGWLTRRAELWTDCERQPVVRLVVGCRVE